MNDCIITRIEQYLIEELSNPINHLFLSAKTFKELSYARETVNIIMDRITDHPFEDPYDIIWQFQIEIEYLCHLAKGRDALFIFYIMRDTTEKIARLIA